MRSWQPGMTAEPLASQREMTGVASVAPSGCNIQHITERGKNNRADTADLKFNYPTGSSGGRRGFQR